MQFSEEYMYEIKKEEKIVNLSSAELPQERIKNTYLSITFFFDNQWQPGRNMSYDNSNHVFCPPKRDLAPFVIIMQ